MCQVEENFLMQYSSSLLYEVTAPSGYGRGMGAAVCLESAEQMGFAFVSGSGFC